MKVFFITDNGQLIGGAIMSKPTGKFPRKLKKRMKKEGRWFNLITGLDIETAPIKPIYG